MILKRLGHSCTRGESETALQIPKGPCRFLVYTWALQGVATLLLWGLCMYDDGAWTLWECRCSAFGPVRHANPCVGLFKPQKPGSQPKTFWGTISTNRLQPENLFKSKPHGFCGLQYLHLQQMAHTSNPHLHTEREGKGTRLLRKELH